MPISKLVGQINRITVKLFQQALVDVFLVLFGDLYSRQHRLLSSLFLRPERYEHREGCRDMAHLFTGPADPGKGHGAFAPREGGDETAG